jgi:hypothetical protein
MRLGWLAAIVAIAALGLVAAPSAASGAAAEVFHFNFTEEQSFTDVNPCTGETFAVTGTLHSSTTITRAPNGNNVIEDVGAFSGTAIGDTGARYEVQTVGGEHGGVFLAGPDRQLVILLNPTLHFIRLGEDGTPDDWFFHVVVVVHIDLDTLTITHDVEHSSTECR